MLNVEDSVIFLRRAISEAELRNELGEAEALGYIETLHKIERALLNKKSTSVVQFTIGDDIFNSVQNKMGSFRSLDEDGVVVVRTSTGLERWEIEDCSKFLGGEE